MRHALVLFCLLLAAPALAQTGGPDTFGYSYGPTPFDFVPLEAVGTSYLSSGNSANR